MSENEPVGTPPITKSDLANAASPFHFRNWWTLLAVCAGMLMGIGFFTFG